MLKQANRERINQDTHLNTSDEISNTEDNGATHEEYTNRNGEEDAYSSSGLSSPSPTKSDGNPNDLSKNNPQGEEPSRYKHYDPRDEHRNNPLFRSDAFE